MEAGSYCGELKDRWCGERCGDWGEVDEVATKLVAGVEFSVRILLGETRVESKPLPNHHSAIARYMSDAMCN